MKSEDVLSFSELIGKSKKDEPKIEPVMESTSEVMSFLEFLEQDTNSSDEVKQQIQDLTIETEKELKAEEPELNYDDRTNKVIEALKKTNIHSRINLLDKSYLEDAYQRYLTEINSEEYKRKRKLAEPQLVSGGLKKVISGIVEGFSSRIGFAIIGKSRIA